MFIVATITGVAGITGYIIKAERKTKTDCEKFLKLNPKLRQLRKLYRVTEKRQAEQALNQLNTAFVKYKKGE